MKCNMQKALPLDANIHITENVMRKLPRPMLGEIVHTTDTNKLYVYTEDGWQELNGDVKLEGQGLQMSLYDLNQNIMDQLGDMTDFTNKIALINEFRGMTANQYYMLYCKDISYFTIFKVGFDGEFDNLGEGVIECLKNVGPVKVIDYTENKDAIEIWVKGAEHSVCMYLFPYDSGIVEVKGV